MNILLHACCAPCTAGTLSVLCEEAIYPVLYWNNPNIHPFREYEARLGALRQYAQTIHVPLIVDGSYGLRAFLEKTSPSGAGRCTVCYAMRLSQAARHAAKEGFDAFTTTLLVSPMQNREAILEAGREAAAREGIAFLERDFRPGYEAGRQEVRDLDLYMQKYCGCIFSEEERYKTRAARIQTGFFANFGSAPERP